MQTVHIPTPDLSHLSVRDFEDVYEPAEDTFCLLDALELDAARLKHSRLCLEIGSGSGVVSAFLCTLLGPPSACVIATDINPHAARATLRTAKQNGVCIDTLITTLHTSLLPRLQGLVDVLVFNPPYVPTSEDEQLRASTSPSLASAWAGGSEGTNILRSLLPVVPILLSSEGTFYLVAIEQNRPEEIKAEMRTVYGLQADTVLRRRAGRELLSVLRITR